MSRGDGLIKSEGERERERREGGREGGREGERENENNVKKKETIFLL